MLIAALLAALAAVPLASAQDVTSSATRCTTRFGYYPLPTGTAAVPTWYRYTTTTNSFSITYTTRDTVTATPSATTFTDVITSTTTLGTTTTSTPAPTTIATPAGFLPLLAVDIAAPTAIPRFRRAELGAHAGSLLKRQTAANHTGGFSVDRNGLTSSLDRKYPHRVDCRVAVTINSTSTTIVTGLPETVFVAGPTATALSTSVVSTTVTVTEVLPQATVYAACQGNNVVNHITDFNGNTLIFDRVIYRPAQGFPIENELIVNTTTAGNCCVACHTTPNCAGSFFAPSDGECHLRLTQPPALPPTLPAPSASPLPYPSNSSAPALSYNATYPSLVPSGGLIPYPAASNAPLSPTGVSSGIYPSGTATPGTCAAGSLSLYLGTIQGQEDFPIEYALAFSNGPCGRLSVWPVPVRGLDERIEE